MEPIWVCVITSWTSATNIIVVLTDALLNSAPMVAITGQVPHCISGTNAFQEMSITKVTRSITKHNYLIFYIDDIPDVIHQRKKFGDHCVDFFHIILSVIITTGL
jgi:acetolactate synthase I/II/III large subunit